MRKVFNTNENSRNGQLRRCYFVKTLLFVLSGSLFTQVFAQTAYKEINAYLDYAVFLFVVVAAILFVGFMFYVDKKSLPSALKRQSVIGIILSKLSGATPIEKENDILLDHDFDGIKELDNDLPPWWKYLFYITIVFAVVYFTDYHIFSSNKSAADEYKEEVRIAELQKAELIKTGAFISETSVVLLKDVDALAKGREIFSANCATCHGAKGEGLVGPNLTDDYWIHGGGIKNVFKTVKYGVPSKGMLTWQTQLSPKQIQYVASFVISLYGTNPPNAKPPQGNLYKEESDTLTTTSIKKM